MDEYGNVKEIKTVRRDDEANTLLDKGWKLLDLLTFGAEKRFVMVRLDDEQEQPTPLEESEAVVDRINELKDALKAVDGWVEKGFVLGVDEAEGLVPAGTCYYCGERNHTNACPRGLVDKALYREHE